VDRGHALLVTGMAARTAAERAFAYRAVMIDVDPELVTASLMFSCVCKF
jgi:hypothetical protein